MKRSDELRQLRAGKMDDLTSISATAASAMLTEEQRSKAISLKNEIEAIETDIQLAEMAEAEEARKALTIHRAKQPQKSAEEKVSERYSFMRAVRMAASGSERHIQQNKD